MTARTQLHDAVLDVSETLDDDALDAYADCVESSIVRAAINISTGPMPAWDDIREVRL